MTAAAACNDGGSAFGGNRSGGGAVGDVDETQAARNGGVEGASRGDAASEYCDFGATESVRVDLNANEASSCVDDADAVDGVRSSSSSSLSDSADAAAIATARQRDRGGALLVGGAATAAD